MPTEIADEELELLYIAQVGALNPAAPLKSMAPAAVLLSAMAQAGGPVMVRTALALAPMVSVFLPTMLSSVVFMSRDAVTSAVTVGPVMTGVTTSLARKYCLAMSPRWADVAFRARTAPRAAESALACNSARSRPARVKSSAPPAATVIGTAASPNIMAAAPRSLRIRFLKRDMDASSRNSRLSMRA